MWIETWESAAACRDENPDWFFADASDQPEATWICHGCPVQVECLTSGLRARVQWGVWGGLTARERRQLLRERSVSEWVALLRAAKLAAPPEEVAALLRSAEPISAVRSLAALATEAPRGPCDTSVSAGV